MTDTVPLHHRVAASLERSPILGVVRTGSRATAAAQARRLMDSGLAVIEITFTVPDATELVRDLLAERGEACEPWIGMGTVTDRERAEAALEAGAELFVTPNVEPEVATVARAAGRYLILGALTPTEIVAAHRLGADLVKVYPLPPVGGAQYLSVVRGPLGNIPMLAAGGFGVDEIPSYRAAGAVAFGMAAPLLGTSEGEKETRRRVALALSYARTPAVPV